MSIHTTRHPHFPHSFCFDTEQLRKAARGIGVAVSPLAQVKRMLGSKEEQVKRKRSEDQVQAKRVAKAREDAHALNRKHSRIKEEADANNESLAEGFKEEKYYELLKQAVRRKSQVLLQEQKKKREVEASRRRALIEAAIEGCSSPPPGASGGFVARCAY